MTLDDWKQSKGKPTLTNAQVKRLAKLVAYGIKEMGYPNVNIPLIGDYRAARHLLDGCWCDLVIKTHIGKTQVNIPVFAMAAAIGRMPSIAALAKQIISFVYEHHTDYKAAKDLSDANFRIRRYLRRNQSDIILKSLEYKIIHRRRVLHELTAKFDVLDNLLRPASQILIEYVGGQVSAKLRKLVEVQNRRRAVSDEMPEAGKVIQVDSLAEYAITASGRNVIQVVRKMCSRNPTDHLYTPITILNGHLENDYFAIKLIDARLSLEIYVRGRLFLRNEEMIATAVFSEIVKTALSGEELINVVKDKMIKPDARIAACKHYDEERMLILIEHESRLISLPKLLRIIR